MSSVIRTRGLVKRFADVRALDGLDLDVPRGEVFAFLGPNGAGKTTTLQLLLGLLKPDDGEIRVLGHDATRRPLEIRRRVGVLLEHDGLYERLSVHANLDVWGRLYGLGTNERQGRVRRLLKEMDLHARRHDRVHTLSRGMRRKLALARALLGEPELLILDEPTTGLDPHAVVDLRRRLRELVAEHDTTVLLTTHNLPEAGRIADRVAVINQGRVVDTGTPADLAKRHGASHVLVLGERLDRKIADSLQQREGVLSAASQQTGDTLRLRLKGDTPLAPLLRLILQDGGEVEATERHEEDLEEIFLHLVRSTNRSAPAPDPRRRTVVAEAIP